MSSTLDNYLQSQQQSSSTAHNHRSVQTRPADQVRPMQWSGERDLCNLYWSSAQLRIRVYTRCHRYKRPACVIKLWLWSDYWHSERVVVTTFLTDVQSVSQIPHVHRANSQQGFLNSKFNFSWSRHLNGFSWRNVWGRQIDLCGTQRISCHGWHCCETALFRGIPDTNSAHWMLFAVDLDLVLHIMLLYAKWISTYMNTARCQIREPPSYRVKPMSSWSVEVSCDGDC